MSLQPVQASVPTRDQASSHSNQTFAGSAVSQSNRAKRRLAKEKRETLHRKRVLEHLREVDQQNQGKRHRSIRLYIKRCNKQLAQESCTCVLFGEKDYFLDNWGKTLGPAEGFRIIVHDDEGYSDCDSKHAW